MKKLLIGMVVVAAGFIFTGCSNERYTNFLDIDYIVQILNDAPTQAEIRDLGFNLIDRSQRVNNERVAINNRRRQEGTTTTRTQGTIHGFDGPQWVDLVTTQETPDSELDLLPMITVRGVMETDGILRGARNRLHRISFHFAEVYDDDDRLLRVTVHRARSFNGIDFSQFTRDHELEEKLDVFIAHGFDAEIYYPVNGFPRIVIFYENAIFELMSWTIQAGESMSVNVNATLVH